MIDLHETVAAVVGGQPQAFALIVREFRGPVVRYVQNMIGDGHAAEDVAQQVFINAYRALHAFDARKARFNTWLFRIAHNLAINELRRVGRQRVRYTTALPEAEHGETPHAIAERREAFALLDGALGGLSDDHRAALVLHEFEGLSCAQVAEVVGVAEGTVKSRLARARAALCEAMTQRIEMEP